MLPFFKPLNDKMLMWGCAGPRGVAVLDGRRLL